jgi:hypothetical protein
MTKTSAKSEIDSLFGKVKKAKVTGAVVKVNEGKQVSATATTKTGATAVKSKSLEKARPPRDGGSASDVLGTGPKGNKARRFTEEGYPIYTEEELGLEKPSGTTPQCPFDCNCCF